VAGQSVVGALDCEGQAEATRPSRPNDSHSASLLESERAGIPNVAIDNQEPTPEQLSESLEPRGAAESSQASNLIHTLSEHIQNTGGPQRIRTFNWKWAKESNVVQKLFKK
jgi:hypothetical protein